MALGKDSIRVGVVAVWLGLSWGDGLSAEQRPDNPKPGRVDFNRDIRPIFAENCYACHGPDQNQRKAGLRLDVKESALGNLESGKRAIVPGDISASELIRRVLAADEGDRMPPLKTGKVLKPEQIGLLKDWIEQGAVWERHWAYQRPARPRVPEVENQSWPRTDVDHFILARLEKEGLKPSAEADRATLIRRVSLDLTGLPPTIEEVDTFLNDRNPEAYERLVERLLDSPHYGERMAQHWLDLARYADTNGYHIDNHRDMWLWREWVINAFNRNMPFNEFTIEQLAGDMLPKATLEQKIASGFNRNGMVNFEGGADPDEYGTKYVVDRVVTTSTVWLGSTMGCAECHDHKYDPFTQKEFYQLYAFFNNVPEKGLDGQKENPVPSVRVPTPEQGVRLVDLLQALPEAEKNFKARELELPALQVKWEQEMTSKPLEIVEPEGLLARFPFESNLLASAESRSMKQIAYGGSTNSPVWVQGKIGRGLKLDGKGGHVEAGNTADFDRDSALSYGAWVKAEGKGGVIVSKMDDSSGFRGFDLGLVEGKIWAHLVHQWDTNALKVVSKANAPKEGWSHLMVVYNGSSKAAGLKLYLNGKRIETDIDKDSLSNTIRTPAPLRIGKRSDSYPFQGAIDEVRIYPRALADAEIKGLADAPALSLLKRKADERSEEQNKEVSFYFRENHAAEFKKSESAVLKLRQAKDELFQEMPATMVMEEMNEPRKTHLLVRGDFRRKAQEVKPGVPKALPPLPEGEPANRLTLARWLVDGQHPLTARVTVNRFWQMLFGTGLVKTSNDFGSQGEWPSHPELLDWLACELADRHWDVKSMLRTLVTSAVYRQTSVLRPDLRERDPYNPAILILTDPTA